MLKEILEKSPRLLNSNDIFICDVQKDFVDANNNPKILFKSVMISKDKSCYLISELSSVKQNVVESGASALPKIQGAGAQMAK